MWFWLSLVTLVCWSGSDLFSKIGCRENDDKLSHLKMLTAVGAVMGLHCLYSVTLGGVSLDAEVIFRYLPISFLYILSMAIGYFGLRFIELSISSPICNSSGALVAVLTFITAGRGAVNTLQLIAVGCVSVGVILLGVVEFREDDELRLERQKEGNFLYTKSALALILPILYCVLDALGTFADNLVLETLDESAANASYELTFFAVGLFSFCYVVFVKKGRFVFRRELPKYAGALCETAGQFAYIYAIGDSDHIMLSAPIISSYCVLSVVWGRLFLKEKLSAKHYLAIAIVVVGIAIIGFFDA